MPREPTISGVCPHKNGLDQTPSRKNMGQAKLKGTFEQRRATAIATARSKFPVSVKCNNCDQDITDIHPMDVSGLAGMRLAGSAVCVSCSHVTWILDGTPEALAQMQQFLSEEHGDDVKSGVAARD